MVQSGTEWDAVVVGSGPNGFGAAITLAEAGCRVLLIEGKAQLGGGMRTEEVTLPGFRHDICSAIHPLGIGSPFMAQAGLESYGLEWVHPPAAVAHPLDNGHAAVLYPDLAHNLAHTAATLGKDGERWRQLMEQPARNWHKLAPALLGPKPWPRHPIALAGFGLRALWPARSLAEILFRDESAKALFGGLAAHAILPLSTPFTAAFGLVLGMLGHAVGWPFPKGGAQAIVDALAKRFRQLGGIIETNRMIRTLDELPPSRATLLDINPDQFVQLAGTRLPSGYRRRLARYRYGWGVCKIDYALDGPVPWLAEECGQAGTVHLGGTLAEIAAAERAVGQGRHPPAPYVLAAQQTLFDATRAPEGMHTLWAYCHTPRNSQVDMTGAIERQLERFAPGFGKRVVARSVRRAVDLHAYNPNYVGGDINGGRQDWRQMWTRPLVQWNPYATALPGVYLCSSSTPPGGGVHGMCGYHAAKAALAHL